MVGNPQNTQEISFLSFSLSVMSGTMNPWVPGVENE